MQVTQECSALSDLRWELLHIATPYISPFPHWKEWEGEREGEREAV